VLVVKILAGDAFLRLAHSSANIIDGLLAMVHVEVVENVRTIFFDSGRLLHLLLSPLRI
jgi:hypothetical protein